MILSFLMKLDVLFFENITAPSGSRIVLSASLAGGGAVRGDERPRNLSQPFHHGSVKMKEMLGGCCVCADENGWAGNPLVYCDGPGCEVAVHQGCYGIIEVPDGEWLCARCAAGSSTQLNGVNGHSEVEEMRRNGRLPTRCELCPFGYGALKRTENGGWAHVICALYIPEVRFGDVHSMDPIMLSDVPHERFEKSCYLCEEEGHYKLAGIGACMQCNKIGCKRGFHVTCAQQRGLLCEEGGQSKNVKYCGYCENHLKKAASDPFIKIVPAVRLRPSAHPVPAHPTPPISDPGVPPNSLNSNQLGPSPPQVAHVTMLVEPLPRPPDPHLHPSLVSLPNGSADESHLLNNFSPPLTVSSQSSIAHDVTPPLGMLRTENHLLQVGGQTMSGNPLSTHLPNNLNALVSVAVGHSAELTNHNRLAALATHTNGIDPKIEPEMPTGVVLKANTAKRPREPKAEGDKPKRPRNSNRPSQRMKTLLDLVGPVVTETVSDFQRSGGAGPSTIPAMPAGAQMQHPTPLATLPNGATIQIGSAPPSATLITGPALVGMPTGPTTSRPSHQSTLPSSMEQLLERQWEQGTQFLLSQAQPFDVAQLLTCLHQLKTENVRLHEQLNGLSRRKEHLMALNTRLNMPLVPPSSMQAQPLSVYHQSQPMMAVAPMSTAMPSPHHSPHVPSSSHTFSVSEENLAQIRNLTTSGMSAMSQTPLSVLPRPSSLARPPSQTAPTASFATPSSSAHSFLPQHSTPPGSTNTNFQQRPTISMHSIVSGTSPQIVSSPAPGAPSENIVSTSSAHQAISPERLLANVGLLPSPRGLLGDPLLTQFLLQQQQQQQQQQRQSLFSHPSAAQILAQFMLPGINQANPNPAQPPSQPNK
ncbi:unnamed protein product, partial [Mesorhabditis belari]|uniref:Protein AF-10 n=1 Tax=Mesorhabditis belari TaxID=2138241 RepID=A0AAF3E9E2_9BILA